MSNKEDIMLSKPIAFNAEIAHEIGINAAIFLHQIHYWMGKGDRDDGFIYKTKKELERETALSRYQQDQARSKLEEMGLLEVENKKANGTPTLHYKVNYDAVEGSLTGSGKTNDSDSEKLTNGNESSQRSQHTGADLNNNTEDYSREHTQNAREETSVSEDEIESIIDYWNTIGDFPECREITGHIRRGLAKRLQNWDRDEICQAIGNYSQVVYSDEYYHSHKYTLKEFIVEDDKFKKWIDDIEWAKDSGGSSQATDDKIEKVRRVYKSVAGEWPDIDQELETTIQNLDMDTLTERLEKCINSFRKPTTKAQSPMLKRFLID
jgi:hypothetical protein